MDDRRTEIIVANVEFAADSIARLREKQGVSFAEYRDDPDTRDIVERQFQKLIEACLDIARTVLRGHEGSVPETNADCMRELGNRGILSESLAAQMASAAGFRNVLTHQYGRQLNHQTVHDALHDLGRFEGFLRSIRDHLDAVGALD